MTYEAALLNTPAAIPATGAQAPSDGFWKIVGEATGGRVFNQSSANKMAAEDGGYGAAAIALGVLAAAVCVVYVYGRRQSNGS
jgi:hypothetical protein